MIIKIKSINCYFKPKLIPTVSTIIALGILISLGVWQLKRLVWKENLIQIRVDRFEGKSIPLNLIDKPFENEFRKVTVEGKLKNNIELFMPALSKNGNNGFHILTLIELENKKYIIYDTGWVPNFAKSREKRLNHFDNKFSEKVAVIRLPGRKGKYQPENDQKKNFWFFVEPRKISNVIGLDVEQKYYLEALNNGPNGFPLGNQTRIYIRNNHLQYAITWFLIALGLIGVYLAASINKKK